MVRTPGSHGQVPGLQSLVRELRSHKVHGAVQKKKKRHKTMLDLEWTLNPVTGVLIRKRVGTSLVVQWLRLCAPNVAGPCLIPGWGTGHHMLRLKS